MAVARARRPTCARTAGPGSQMNGMPSVRHSSAYCTIAAGSFGEMIARSQARRVAKRQLAGVGHRAGVERRDLVVVGVGAAEERRRELPGHVLHERRVDARRLEPAPVVVEILTGRRHQRGPLAEQRQRVGDVRRAAAAALVHRVDEKTQAHPRHVLRQEVLGELPGKRHQVVEGDRAGDDDGHDSVVVSVCCQLQLRQRPYFGSIAEQDSADSSNRTQLKYFPRSARARA